VRDTLLEVDPFGADIFLADVTGRYLGRICQRECHPNVSPSIAGAASISMTTFMSSRYRKR
jgi:hypothetical protein